LIERFVEKLDDQAVDRIGTGIQVAAKPR